MTTRVLISDGEEVRGIPWLSPSSWTAFLASVLTAFTVPLVGEMPVGEFFLVAAAVWATVVAVLRGASAGPLLRAGLLWAFLAAQFIALCAYVISDLYWRSAPRDMLRGWSRMIFLAIDVVAVAYLFGCARRNFMVFLAGQCIGEVASALILGPMFGDMWKFGIGTPVTYLVLGAGSLIGPWGAAAAAAAMGMVHFALDYRSLGGLCAAAAALTLLPLARQKYRAWLLPVAGAAAIGAVMVAYPALGPQGQRTTRSDVERTAMIEAAGEAFEQSPLLGHGSWFSNSHVYDEFMLIRDAKAREAHVGGFAGANHDPGDVALHSQMLVALAEGGLFGGAFFVVFGAALLWNLGDLALFQAWNRPNAIYMMVILVALWNLALSPFSGAHRVYIAEACGLMLGLGRNRLAVKRGGDPWR